MEPITILIFVVLLLLILAFITSIIDKRLRGGAYFNYYVKGESESGTIIVSPSEYSFYHSKFRDPYELLDEAIESVKYDAEIYYKGQILTNKTFQGQRLSDAFIDTLFAVKEFKSSEAFGACEVNTNVYHETKTNLQLKSNQLTHYCRRKIETNLYNDKMNFNQFAHRDHNAFSFLEFSYPKNIVDIVNAYKTVHETTAETFKLIADDLKTNKSKKCVYIYKYLMDKNGNIQNKESLCNVFSYVRDDISIKVYGNFNPLSDRIPNNVKPTKKDAKIIQHAIVPEDSAVFKADEIIDLKFGNRDMMIQIEHSEGFAAHKSNIVEFILSALRTNYIAVSADDKQVMDYALRFKDVKYSTFDKFVSGESSIFNKDDIPKFQSQFNSINIVCLTFLTLVFLGYDYDGRFKSSVVKKDSVFRSAWKDFADNYFNIEVK